MNLATCCRNYLKSESGENRHPSEAKSRLKARRVAAEVAPQAIMQLMQCQRRQEPTVQKYDDSPDSPMDDD